MERHRDARRTDARATLQLCGIALGADFHKLPSDSVDKLLAEADRRRYQKPRKANGSRARYFHDYVQRMAK